MGKAVVKWQPSLSPLNLPKTSLSYSMMPSFGKEPVVDSVVVSAVVPSDASVVELTSSFHIPAPIPIPIPTAPRIAKLFSGSVNLNLNNLILIIKKLI